MFIVNGKRFPTVTQKGIYGFFQEYRWLSNFHMCPVTVDNITFPSSEHAFMAMKTLDHSVRRHIAHIDRPQDAKAYGRGVELRRGWDQGLRVTMMEKVLDAKFSQNIDLARKLLATCDKHLEETNNWGDRFWGVVDGHGENQLGNALMRVRRRLYLVGDHEAIYQTGG